MRKPPPLQVEEVQGNKYPDRAAAQRAAMPMFTENLQAVIRDLIARGVLVNANGKLIPNPKDKAA